MLCKDFIKIALAKTMPAKKDFPLGSTDLSFPPKVIRNFPLGSQAFVQIAPGNPTQLSSWTINDEPIIKRTVPETVRL